MRVAGIVIFLFHFFFSTCKGRENGELLGFKRSKNAFLTI